MDNNVLPRFHVDIARNLYISSVCFPEIVVSKAINGASSTASHGPDNIPSVVLKVCVDVLSEPLSQLFTALFESRSLPNDFRYADVVPVYKGSVSTASPNNYRPISLTSTVGKIMETCVKNDLLAYLVSNRLLSTHQHGFLPKKSTLSELLECLNDWMSAIENGEYVDVVYVDLKKAFDSVVHSKLLLKCEKYGIKGNLLEYIKAFLSDRWQRVKVGDSLSGWKRVTSGVPQGSVLGPLLFLIYINDMPDILSTCTAKLYADDSKLYKSGPRPNLEIVGLQRDLTTFELWCRDWQLNINAAKCNVLKIGTSRNGQEPIYRLGGEIVQTESCVKDLGVFIDTKLNFSQHCSRMCARISRKIGLIYRTFSGRTLEFMRTMFVTHIRPIAEYNSEIWSPCYVKDIDLVENLQRRFTKRIKGMYRLEYSERLKRCNLESLELRRIKKDLVLVYKIIHRLIGLEFNDFFSYAPRLGTRGNSLKLYPTFAGRTVVVNSFNFRVINVWNSLSDPVVTSTSLCVFKRQLDSLDAHLTSFLKRRAFRNP